MQAKLTDRQQHSFFGQIARHYICYRRARGFKKAWVEGITLVPAMIRNAMGESGEAAQ